MRTRARQPKVPKLVDAYAKGVLSRVEHYNTVKPRTTIGDDFQGDLSNWQNVQGKLKITSGNINSDGLFGYAAGIHKTELLSDNCRVKVTMQDGFISAGKSCVFLCADKRMNFYYGLVIETGLINNKFHIVRGTGTKSRQILKLPNGNPASYVIDVDPDDYVELWHDEPNSVLRAYYNGSQVMAVPVDRNDIPHGPGRRFTGVVMGIDWFLSPGVLFEDFSAWDVALPGPFLRDGFDGPDVSSDWTVLDNGVKIHRHFFGPNTIGPDNVFWSDAAILHATQASQDSVKIVTRVFNHGAGKYTVVLCSNSTMTNWMGVQFETGVFNNKIHIVKGTGPTDYTSTGETTWAASPSGTVFVITYNSATNKLAVSRTVSKAPVGSPPIVEWTPSGVAMGPGNRSIGMVWETALLSPGVEPSMFEAYNVTADAPL